MLFKLFADFPIQLLAISLASISLLALMLFGLTKVFKLHDPGYKKSLFVVLVLAATSLGLSLIGMIGGIYALLGASLTLIFFFVLHCLLKKEHHAHWTRSFWISIYLAIGAIALFFVLLLASRTFLFQPFIISGNSMSPAYTDGNYVFVTRGKATYARGDVVVFINPIKHDFYVQRLIGLPGEKVEIRDGTIFIDGRPLVEQYKTEESSETFEPVELGSTEYYVLGDRRNHANDSRLLGPIPESEIVGKIFYKLY